MTKMIEVSGKTEEEAIAAGLEQLGKTRDEVSVEVVERSKKGVLGIGRTDAVVRLIPGALGDETSALSDSFQDGLLAPPVYTRPAEFNGWKVPDVLLSGNPKLIQAWQDEQALQRTKELRPELLSKKF